MRTWTRPYADPMRWFTGAIASAGTMVCLFAGLQIVTHWERIAPIQVLPVAAFFSVWLTLAWRLHRTALVVSPAGVRVRWLWATRTVPWERVDGFRTGSDWLVADRLWIALGDGTELRTPVRRRTPEPVTLRDGGTALAAGPYADLLATLDRWRAAAPPVAPPA
ncbi:PH domain-containing protein [Micromonospora sp. WMMD956]|uniref:PH domain-containing protein n=1 Tax=Micromonospora TaxID=1873 RepID=UPI002416DF9D|nr:PH domain-containing protein [Micromonospora sp. WMMD956]MDG4818335.1 PH domain-containing protein [Micromonospora sp. WMMD956]